MNRKLAIIAAVSSLLLLAAGAAVAGNAPAGAAAPGNRSNATHGLSIKQQSLSHGDFFILLDNTGMPVPMTDLVDCSALPVPIVLRVRGTFDYYDGVCDDSAGPACDGKLIYRSEFCVAEFSAQSELSSRIFSQFGRAKTRICHDRDGDGECLAAEQVAAGFVIIQDQAFATPAGIQAPAREIAVRTITASRPFRFDGKTVRIPRNGTLVNVLLDLPPGFPETPLTPDACFGQACGYAASGVSVGR